MSNKTKIEEALHDLIKEDREFVVMLSGEWGIGKTYFWNEFKNIYLKPKDVVYISLFGKNSLQDIEAEIVTKLSKYTKGLKKYAKHLDTVSNLGSKAMGLPINVSMGSILSLFSPNDFKNIIICFDDFERLSEKTSLKDVMGLISQFKEQKECKVIMILNEKELNKLSSIDGKKHDEIFSLYKEKIVDYNFHYKPSQKELFEAIKKDIEEIKFCNPLTIYNFFKTVDLTNIRIMKQSIYLLNHFSFICTYKLDDKVINEFVEIALNLFIFKAKSNYTYSDFQDMEEYASEKMLQDFSEDENFKLNEKHDKFSNYYYTPNNRISSTYYSQNKDIIEKIVYSFLDSHYLTEQDLQKQLEENNQSLDWYNMRNEISKLNTRLYTDFSVQNQNDEITKQLFTILNKHKDVMHRLFQYSDYKPFIENINKFSPKTITGLLEKEIAENYIELYIDNPHNDTSGPLNRGGGQSSLLTSDYDWTHTYIEEYKKKTQRITPEEVLPLIKNILDSRHLSEDDVFKLNQISAEDYEKQIKENHNLIQPLFKFLEMPDSKDVSKNIIDALESLKKENDDYAWKVTQLSKIFGITIEKKK